MSTHPVYPEGPDCRESCPGSDTLNHADYAEGFIAGEQALTSAIIRTLPSPPKPKVPADVWGPTRKRWTRRGIKAAYDSLGFRS